MYRLFTGRVSREQFVQGFIALIFGVAVVSVLAGIVAGSIDYGFAAIIAFCVVALTMVIGGVFILGLAVRRIHDLGKSGWYAILLLISPLNVVVLIILAVENGKLEENEYGSIPESRPLLAVLANAPRHIVPTPPDSGQ